LTIPDLGNHTARLMKGDPGVPEKKGFSKMIRADRRPVRGGAIAAGICKCLPS